MLNELTRNVEVKIPLTAEQKDELLKQISAAYKVIADNDFQINELKEQIGTLKDANSEQSETVKGIIAKYDRGYDLVTKNCSAIYKDGEATFLDKDGVIVEQREITPEEQLQLSENRIDADILTHSENED